MTAMITPQEAVTKGFDHAVSLVSPTLEVGEDATDIVAVIQQVAVDLIVAQQKVLDQVQGVFDRVAQPEPVAQPHNPPRQTEVPAPVAPAATVPPVPVTRPTPNPQVGAPGSLTEGYDRPFSSSRGQVKNCYGKLIALNEKLGRPDPLTGAGMPQDLWVDYFSGRRNGKPHWKALEALSKFAAANMIGRMQIMLDGKADPGVSYRDTYWDDMEPRGGIRGRVAEAAAARNGGHVDPYEAPF